MEEGLKKIQREIQNGTEEHEVCKKVKEMAFFEL